ncbi:hypothetical protein [Methylovulum sp.]|uniref:hypothetical protein n=1 Tax=Methylovulum sp. TaxID=1916980 RepID=UPI002631F156|nr:hypothetical protein [Methylovulum sp.]MDD5125021.1 hypothetical protein [Methylovulum sp.]
MLQQEHGYAEAFRHAFDAQMEWRTECYTLLTIPFFLGATYDSSKVAWSWITGEKFNFTFSFGDSSRNILMMVAPNGYWWNVKVDGSSVYDSSLGQTLHNAGYICEWDGNHFVANASVPDLNGNGVAENASLYVDYKNSKHTVIIRDPKTHQSINTLTFTTSVTPPIGLAVIADMNSNGTSEIAVLSKLNVQIKDAKDNKNVLNAIDFLSKKYQPRALSITPDTDNNGFDELTVLGILQSGTTTSETRDSSTGEKLFSDTF